MAGSLVEDMAGWLAGWLPGSGGWPAAFGSSLASWLAGEGLRSLLEALKALCFTGVPEKSDDFA